MDNTSRERAGGYSASVELRLHVNGCVFRVSQVGPDRIHLRTESALPEGPAELAAIIDGHESRWSVRIDDRETARKIVPIKIIKHLTPAPAADGE